MRRFAGWVLVAAGLAGIIPGDAAAKPSAEVKVAERLDALLNAGKPAEAAALFAEGATAKAPDGRTLTGRDAIAGWLGAMPGLKLASGNRQGWEGGRVTWATSVSDDRLVALGVAPLAANAEATITDGLITALTIRYTAESRMKLADASAKERETLYRNSLQPAAAGADLLAALPDLKLTAESVLVANDQVAAKGTLAGTWTGIYLGVTGTGQPVTAEFSGTAVVTGGAVTESKLLVDTKSLLDQMGFTVTHPALAPKPAAVPRPAAAPKPANPAPKKR